MRGLLNYSLFRSRFSSVGVHTQTHKLEHVYTWMPSSSLLMHQKLSASMFLRASSWRLETSKFSTSSSGKEEKRSATGKTLLDSLPKKMGWLRTE